MVPRMPSPTTDTTAPIAFSLRVWPESSQSTWRAELYGEDGVRAVFTTPLDLLRHLADAGGTPTGAGGLR